MSSVEGNTLPKGWVEKKLKDKEVCELIMGQSPSSDTYNTEGKGMPFFQGKKEFGDISPVVEKYCTSPKKIAFPGDILMSVRAPVGPTNIANIECCIGRGLAAIRPNLDFTLKNYLLYYFKNFEVEISKKGKGSTFNAITKNAIEESVIPIPPLSEQKRIVAKIDTLFAKIDKAISLTEESLVQAKNLLPSVLNGVFEKGKADGWKYEKLGVLGKLTSSKRIYKKEYVAQGIPFYRSKEIKELSHNRKISVELFISEQRYTEIKNKFGTPKDGDILLTAVGTIGEMYIVKENEKFYFKDGNIMWLKDFSNLSPYYLRYALTYFVERLKTLSQGSAYQALTIEKLKEYSIPIPALKEQKKIVANLDRISNQSIKTQSKLEEQLAYLKQLKSSILNKAFKGEL